MSDEPGERAFALVAAQARRAGCEREALSARGPEGGR